MVRPEGSWLLDKGDKGTGEQGTRSGRLRLRKGRHVIYIYKNTHNPLPIFLYNLKRKCNLWRKLSLLPLQKRFYFSHQDITHYYLPYRLNVRIEKGWEGSICSRLLLLKLWRLPHILYKTRFLQTAAKSDDFFLKYLLSTRQSFSYSNTWVIEPTGFSPGTSPGGKLNIQWILLSAELNSLFDV